MPVFDPARADFCLRWSLSTGDTTGDRMIAIGASPRGRPVGAVDLESLAYLRLGLPIEPGVERITPTAS